MSFHHTIQAVEMGEEEVAVEMGEEEAEMVEEEGLN